MTNYTRPKWDKMTPREKEQTIAFSKASWVLPRTKKQMDNWGNLMAIQYAKYNPSPRSYHLTVKRDRHCNRKYWVSGLGTYLKCSHVVEKCGDRCLSCKTMIEGNNPHKPRKDKDCARNSYNISKKFPWKFNNLYGTNIYLDLTL